MLSRSSIVGMADQLVTPLRRGPSRPSCDPAPSATRHSAPPRASRSMGCDNRGVPADARQERSGWDTVDPGKRPQLDALRVTPECSTHILDGDATGGGPRPTTRQTGKTTVAA